jgi:hypothetical protein
VLRSISGVVESKSGKARWFGEELKRRLRLAIELWRERRAGPPSADFAVGARGLK